MTDHAEMVLLHRVGKQLRSMNDAQRRTLSVYVTLEPCLMCGSALSFVALLMPGVYIAMNGRYFAANHVRKNRETGVFEPL